MSESLSTRGYITDSTGGGPSTPTLVIGVNTIDVVWPSNVTLTAVGAVASNWAIAAVLGVAVTVLTSIQLNLTTTRLTTTDQTLGGSYILDIPAAAVIDPVSGNPNAFFTVSFTGDGNVPSFVSAVPQTTTTVLVTFSEPVIVSDAINASHYSIDNGLIVHSVAQVSATTFLLTTSETVPGVIYTATVSNIHDLAGNPVT